MPIEDDESRQAARERLRARQGRDTRNASGASTRQRTSSTTGRSSSQRGRSDRRGTASRSSRAKEPARTSRQSQQRSSAGRTGSSRSSGSRSGRSADRYQSSQGRRTPSRQGTSSSSILPDSVPPIFVIGIAVAIVAVFVFSVIMPNCSGRDSKTGAQQSAEQTAAIQQAADAQQRANDFQLNKNEPHQSALAKLIGDESATKLLAKGLTDIDALWIAAHVGNYDFDGMELQYKALKLAADEDEAIPFVRSYPTDYPTAGASEDESLALSTGSPSESVPDTNIPHLYQWDMRWANTGFAGSALGLTGSGPTCLAMVRAGLVGNMSMTPYDVAKAATEYTKTITIPPETNEYGYTMGTEETKTVGAIIDKQGLDADYLYDGAADLGLQCSEMYPGFDAIRDALLQGDVIILDIEPGQFTSTDSFVVLTGIANNSQAVMNDPYSIEHSSRLWDIDELASMATTMYVYST